jgi:formiminotetrahydrofolate cyclodeaminase
MRTAEALVEALKLCVVVAEDGYHASVTDAGVGALMARTGLEAAILNVLINLGQIKDTHIVAAMRVRAQALSEEGKRLEAGVLARARAGFGVIS